MELAGAHVLITGATRGIGRELARELSRRGAGVTISGRDRAQLDELGSSLSLRTVPADMCVADQVDALIPRAEELGGPVDVLVNNAGIFRFGTFADITQESFHAHYSRFRSH